MRAHLRVGEQVGQHLGAFHLQQRDSGQRAAAPVLGPAPHQLHDLSRQRSVVEPLQGGQDVVGVAAPPASSTARVQAWRSLLDEVAARADEQLVRTHVLEFATKPARFSEVTDKGSPHQVDEVFALVARHPLLTPHPNSLLTGGATRLSA